MVLATAMVGAQDMAHYKRVIKELSSAKYQGRGYAKDGANKAGRFLQREFQNAGVDEVTLQPFKLGNLNGYLSQHEPVTYCCARRGVIRGNNRSEIWSVTDSLVVPVSVSP